MVPVVEAHSLFGQAWACSCESSLRNHGFPRIAHVSPLVENRWWNRCFQSVGHPKHGRSLLHHYHEWIYGFVLPLIVSFPTWKASFSPWTSKQDVRLYPILLDEVGCGVTCVIYRSFGLHSDILLGCWLLQLFRYILWSLVHVDHDLWVRNRFGTHDLRWIIWRASSSSSF